jgi:putative peptidoglycan lipid II flippase
VLAGLGSVVVNVGLALALMRPFAQGGLALASSLAAYANLAALVWALHGRLGPLGGRALGVSLARTGMASVALAGACAWARPFLGGGSWRAAALTLAAVVGGVLVYVAVAAALRAPELRDLLALRGRAPRALPESGGE